MTPADAVAKHISEVESAMDATQAAVDKYRQAVSAHMYEIKKCDSAMATLRRLQTQQGDELEALRIAHGRVAVQDADLHAHASLTIGDDSGTD